MRVYCKNFRPKYEMSRPNAVSRAAAATVLPLYCCYVTFILAYRFLNFRLYIYSLIPV